MPAYRSRIRLVVGWLGADTIPPEIERRAGPGSARALIQSSAVHGFA
ncbi:MAG: hypothetical protein ACXVXP_03020 [Mycobacteriaceae bacterium]